MSLLGKSPEEKRYNKIVLIVGGLWVVILVGIFLKSIPLIVLGVILIMLFAPVYIHYSCRYQMRIFKEFSQGLKNIWRKLRS
jgi:Flp pilus assembly protein TadB